MRGLYLLLILVVIGSGCEKYNLKQPAYLNFNWRFHSKTSSQGEVTITKGYFYAKEFTVSGTRMKGSAVQISQTMPAQKIEFSSENELGISFDIPMGDYTEFNLKTVIEASNNPCVRLEGYMYKGTEQIPVIIEWAHLDELNFKILNSFSLEKKKNYKVYIGFDANKLFSTISSYQWQSGICSNENGVTTLMINGNIGAPNAQMFNEITEQIPNSLVLTVE